MSNKTEEQDKIEKVDQGMEIFSFGEPVAMLDKADILSYAETRWNGKYYETPINIFGLAKTQHSNPYHASALAVKRNVLTGLYKPHPWLSRIDFMRFVQDFLIFGDGYFENHVNPRGKTAKVQYRPSKFTRRGKKEGQYVQITTPNGWYTTKKVQKYTDGRIFQLSQPDINQETYGVPEYLSVLQSAWLGEAATLYRRKYYAKGHSGYILYMTDAAQEEGDIETLRKKIKSSRGLDAFRNLFMYAPNGKKEGIQIIPLSDAMTKDDFTGIKNATKDDILGGHRVPLQLMSSQPKDGAALGDANTAKEIFLEIEIKPLTYLFETFNDWIGEEVISFEFPEIAPGI